MGGLLAFGCFSLPAAGSEGFVLLSYSDSAKVHRVFTSDEYNQPVGYLFACDPAEYFIVDSLRNFRLFSSHEKDDFSVAPGYIFRQVFNGTAEEADYGNGHSQYQDQRNLIAADEFARPVFRPFGAPFSAGPGREVEASLGIASLQPDECQQVPGKSWYQIPNSSWYQTWLPEQNSKKSSYSIFYDCWQEKRKTIVESFWRGYVAGKALERDAGTWSVKRLLRARVSGAMELIDGDREMKEVVRIGNKSLLHVPSQRHGEGDVFLYSWHGSSSGKLFMNGQRTVERPVLESKDQFNRFIGVGRTLHNERRIYIIGSDILQMWLKQCGMPFEEVDCSMVATACDSKGKAFLVFVWSQKQQCIYIISIDENNSSQPVTAQQIKIDFIPESIVCDREGRFYAVVLDSRPADFSSGKNLVSGFEAIDLVPAGDYQPPATEDEIKRRESEKFDWSGRIIFARSHYAVLKQLVADEKKFRNVGEIFLDKDYYSCRILLKSVSNKDMSEGIEKILDLASRPGSSISPVEPGADGYPDQYRRPDRVLAAVLSDSLSGSE
jgi:hypothetical protein